MAEVVEGCIEHIIFRNEENGYTVLALHGEEEITCVGNFILVRENLLRQTVATQNILFMDSNFSGKL